MSAVPRTLPGAIVAVDPKGPLARIVVFQYNPDEVTRTIQPFSGSGGGSAGVNRAWGAPKETIGMTLELDATDALERGDPVAGASGILPQLSTLEMLVHPASARVIANSILLAAGTIEVLPIELPLTVLVWGPSRVLPVKLTQLTITEQAFAPSLAPVRASVEIGAEVLTYDDISLSDPAYGLYLAHLVGKEILATAGSAANIAAGIAGLVR